MKINIETIPHKDQRYETVGDWWWSDENTLQIRVSQMSNWKYEMAVAYHELFEALWCKAADVDEDDVTEFDEAYEANRPAGDDSEPGDSPNAPYGLGHQIATKLEKEAFEAWSWIEYDSEVIKL